MGTTCSLDRYITRGCRDKDFVNWLEKNYKCLNFLRESFEYYSRNHKIIPDRKGIIDEKGYVYKFVERLKVARFKNGRLIDSFILVPYKLEKLFFFNDELTDLYNQYIIEFNDLDLSSDKLYIFLDSATDLVRNGSVTIQGVGLRIADACIRYVLDNRVILDYNFLIQDKKISNRCRRDSIFRKILANVLNSFLGQPSQGSYQGLCRDCKYNLLLIFIGDSTAEYLNINYKIIVEADACYYNKDQPVTSCIDRSLIPLITG